MFNKKNLLIFFSLIIAGCVPSNHSSLINYEPTKNNYIDFSTTKTTPIAVDFVDFISCQLPPNETTFLLDPNYKTFFANNLEQILRRYGYAISYTQMQNSVPLAWKIDNLELNKIRVTFTVGGGLVTRQYILNNNIYYPIGVVTAINLNKFCDANIPPMPKNRVALVVEEPLQQVVKKFAIVKTKINIRQEPSVKSKITGTFMAGNKVELDSNFSNSEWSKLKDMQGYIFNQFIDVQK